MTKMRISMLTNMVECSDPDEMMRRMIMLVMKMRVQRMMVMRMTRRMIIYI